MKHLFLCIAIMLVACTGSQTTQQVAQAATMSRMRFHCDSDTTAINQLLILRTLIDAVCKILTVREFYIILIIFILQRI